MKYLFTVLSIFVLALTANAQKFDWEWQNTKPQSNNINDVANLTSSKLVAAGDAGTILISNDGGTTWNYKQIDFTARDLTGIYFINSSTGFVCGDAGLVMKTNDGGITWAELTTGATDKLWDIEFIDANTGYAVGANGIVIKTTNGGTSWSVVTTSITNTIYAVSAKSADNILLGIGYTSGTTNLILRSTDNGTTWASVTPAGFASSIYSISFADNATGYAFCSSAKVLKTTDGGATFTEIKDFGDGSAYSGYFTSATTGYVPVGGVVNITTDGGTTWTSSTVTNKNLRDVVVSSAGIITAGDCGLIFGSSDNGTSWVSKVTSVTSDHLKKIVALDDNTLLAVGGSTTIADTTGFILKTTDGGANWTKMGYNFKFQVYSIAVPTATTWYVGTGDNKMFKTTDAGATWTLQTTPITGTTHDFYDIKFVNENIGYAVGASGKIIKTTDGGANWTSVTNPFGTNIIYSFALFDAQTLIAVGAGPNVQKTTDGGATWSALTTNAPGIPFSVKFKGNFGVVAAYSSKVNNIAVTKDGGATWNYVGSPTNTTVSVWGIAIKDTNSFWVADGGGSVAYTTDGGITWVAAKSPSGNIIYDFAVSGANLWMCGNNGAILKGFLDSTVPVELTSFAASVKNNKVVVVWQTATETNNKGFNVERKASGSDWKNIAFVAGKGTSSEASSYTYEDAAAAGKVYYRLKQVDYDGTFKYSDAIEVDITAPAKFELSQNYPNPFNPTTTIKYSVPQKENVTLKVFNVLGKEVAVLVNSVQDAGSYSAKFDASSLSSGVYFYELSAGINKSFKKMILIK
jgi:photosystem II stability/assembly factor-like uncharacterized protein